MPSSAPTKGTVQVNEEITSVMPTETIPLIEACRMTLTRFEAVKNRSESKDSVRMSSPKENSRPKRCKNVRRSKL